MEATLRLYIGIPVPRDLIVVKTGTVQNMCSNRHVSVLGAAYCSECGGKTSLQDEEDFTPAFKALCEANGTPDPLVGYDNLRERGWTVLVSDGPEGEEIEYTYEVVLGSISVETPYDVGPEIVGLKILIAQLYGIGSERYTSSVMEIPLDGFPLQAKVLKTLGEMLGAAGEPNLYPQILMG